MLIFLQVNSNIGATGEGKYIPCADVADPGLPELLPVGFRLVVPLQGNSMVQAEAEHRGECSINCNSHMLVCLTKKCIFCCNSRVIFTI